MRTMLAVAAMAVCVAGLTAQPAKKDEKKFTSKTGKFAVAFPRYPTEQPIVDTKNAGGLAQTRFLATHDKEKGGYMVIYADLPASVLKAMKPEQVLESGEKGLVENFKAKVTKSSALTVGPNKHPAREFMVEREEPGGATWNARGQIILVGTRLYQVYVFGQKEFLTGKDADAFFASFEITN